MPSLENDSLRDDGTQLSGTIHCDVHTSTVDNLAKAYPEPSDWWWTGIAGGGTLEACDPCTSKIEPARILVLNNCFASIGEITELYSDMILNKSTLRPRSLPRVLKCKMERPCRKSSIKVDYDGQVCFEIPVSENGSGIADGWTKTVCHTFLTDFGGPIAQCLEDAKTGFIWDQSKDEVSNSDGILSIQAKRQGEDDSALGSFRRCKPEVGGDEEYQGESE